MEKGPFEDAFPIKKGDIPLLYYSLPEGNLIFRFAIQFWGGRTPVATRGPRPFLKTRFGTLLVVAGFSVDSLKLWKWKTE